MRAGVIAPVLSVAIVLAPLSLTGIARADEAAKVLQQCEHGHVPKGFSQTAYAKALRTMPTVVNEYSNCEELIRQAQLAGPGSGAGGAGGSGGGAGGGSEGYVPPPTPAEQQLLSRATGHEGATPVRVGRNAVSPGVVHADLASAVSSLPGTLLALLALLALLGAAALTRGVRALGATGMEGGTRALPVTRAAAALRRLDVRSRLRRGR
jgi:hypothetical protein